jgi:Mg-chelatase subunit ChlD
MNPARKPRVSTAWLLGVVLVLAAVAATWGVRNARGPASAADPAPLAEIDAACDSPNPFFVTPCYALGERGNEPALVAFHDTPNDSAHYVLADYGEVGATYGVAYDARRRHVYAAAYHKRAAPHGPGGPGAVYRVDLATGAVETWVVVPDAGDDLHDPAQNYIPDRFARDHVGKTSLGDIDLSEDGEILFVMNLAARRIERYRTATGERLSPLEHGATAMPWAAREARPHALLVHEETLYHGVVRDGSSSRRVTDVWAHVYASDLDGANMRPVLAFGLNYVRQRIPPNIPATWQPWRDGPRTVAPRGTHDHAMIHPMPMLTDLEMSDGGDLVLGLRDRIGDMMLYDRNRNLPRGETSGHPFGDILIARPDAERPGLFTIEPWPEFFEEDAGGGHRATGGFHVDTGFGGLARVRTLNRVLNTVVSPLAYHSGGAIWFDLDTGRDVGRESLYTAPAGRPSFGKANGLGDAELLCGAELPTPTPTATASSAPTPTSTATPQASATPTITPTPTATPTPYLIYLPYGENECIPEKRFVDVVLVLDRSTSMLRSVEEGGLQKNEAAIAAARTFVDTLALEPDVNDSRRRHDQVAVVGFNNDAWVEIPLTNDRAAAEAALESIRTKTKEGTRLDLALTEGQKPLDGPERIRANDAILVLLTDGLPNRVPFDAATGGSQEQTVEASADAVKAAGTNVYAIALGRPNDIHPLLMLQIVSERYQYYYAPLPEDLEAIYKIILDTFTFCGRKNVPPPTPCVPEYQHADILLVLDTSTSMQRETRAGRTKLAAALEAARTFADSLSLERDGYGRQDRLAIVGFNNTAWTELTLSDDRVRIEQAFAALPAKSAEGTRLDLALEQGMRAWTDSWRLPANRPVLVLLTDGLPNRVPFGPGSAHPECASQECTVLKAATAAKQAGARVFTIGLGLPDDVLRRLLEEAASSPRDYAFAPDAEDLAAIYRQVAGRVRACP